MSDACFMGIPKRVGPPFMAPLAWGASSRAMMGPGNDEHWWMVQWWLNRVLDWCCAIVVSCLVTRKRLIEGITRQSIVRMRRLSPRVAPWSCGSAGGQDDVKMRLEGGQRSAAQGGKKKRRGSRCLARPFDPRSCFQIWIGSWQRQTRAETRQGPMRPYP